MDGLNAGYAQLLLDEYLENPEAVPSEWRRLFESGDPELLAGHPGLAKLVEMLGNGNGRALLEAVVPVVPVVPSAPVAPVAPAPVEAPDQELLGGVAAAMALIKAHRMHGHLAARLDPLGSEPPGDPALDPEALIPKLTP
jgi:2-oxoglutarate dehydrogenase complex dehydrogenase (E1) component-like enzyme